MNLGKQKGRGGVTRPLSVIRFFSCGSHTKLSASKSLILKALSDCLKVFRVSVKSEPARPGARHAQQNP